MEELIARMFELRNAAHLAHWASRSYAEHEALGEFYDALIGKLDDVVEVYQGVKGLVGPVQVYEFDRKDILTQIAAHQKWLEANRTTIAAGHVVLENQIDELGAIFGRALYKLRFLS